jgi:hypothetical protein
MVADSEVEADVDGVVMETGAAIKGVDDVMVCEGIGRAVDERCSVVAATNAGFGDCMEVTNVAEPPSRGNDVVVASFFFMASVSLTAVVAGLVTSDVVTVSGGDVDSEVDGEVARTGVAVAVGGGSRALTRTRAGSSLALVSWIWSFAFKSLASSVYCPSNSLVS